MDCMRQDVSIQTDVHQGLTHGAFHQSNRTGQNIFIPNLVYCKWKKHLFVDPGGEL